MDLPHLLNTVCMHERTVLEGGEQRISATRAQECQDELMRRWGSKIKRQSAMMTKTPQEIAAECL